MKTLPSWLVFLLTLIFIISVRQSVRQQPQSIPESSHQTLTILNTSAPCITEVSVIGQEYSVTNGVFRITNFNKDLARVDVDIEFTNTSANPVRLIETLQVYAKQESPLSVSSAKVNGEKVSSIFDWIVNPTQTVRFNKSWHIQNPKEDIVLVCHDFITSSDTTIVLK